MKKKIFLAALIFTATSIIGYSQTVNGVPISDIDVEYVEIVGNFRLFSNKFTITIDFGQESKLFSNRETQIRDEYGQALNFNSMVDALNFMSKNGYDFVDVYVVTNDEFTTHHYLLRKGKNLPRP